MATKLTKHEKAYSVIRQRIIEGEYEPGDRLVIPKVARELAVSALPVREALRRLEAEGFVKFDRNVGARVIGMDFEAWESAMHVLSLLEGYATALAAKHLSPDDIADLREINQAMQTALETSDIAGAKASNRRFHVRLYEACPNEDLMSLVRIGWDRLDALRGWDVYYLLLRGSHLVDEHEQILKMIESDEPSAEIEAYARDHKLRTVDVYQQNRELLPTMPGVREK